MVFDTDFGTKKHPPYNGIPILKNGVTNYKLL
jgi:hypothetical protein